MHDGLLDGGLHPTLLNGLVAGHDVASCGILERMTRPIGPGGRNQPSTPRPKLHVSS